MSQNNKYLNPDVLAAIKELAKKNKFLYYTGSSEQIQKLKDLGLDKYFVGGLEKKECEIESKQAQTEKILDLGAFAKRFRVNTENSAYICLQPEKQSEKNKVLKSIFGEDFDTQDQSQLTQSEAQTQEKSAQTENLVYSNNALEMGIWKLEIKPMRSILDTNFGVEFENTEEIANQKGEFEFDSDNDLDEETESGDSEDEFEEEDSEEDGFDTELDQETDEDVDEISEENWEEYQDDFEDDDIAEIKKVFGKDKKIGFDKSQPIVADGQSEILSWLEKVEYGRVSRLPKVPKIIFVGKPNVGKSSLFNALAGENIQIVSDIAGTTLSVNDTLIEVDL